MAISSQIKMQGNNYNQRLIVHLPTDICRTIIGSGGMGGYHSGNEPKVIVKSTNRMGKNDLEIKKWMECNYKEWQWMLKEYSFNQSMNGVVVCKK